MSDHSSETSSLETAPEVTKNGKTLPMGRRPGRKSAKLRLCTICGDRASGVNFNVLTCMSCKAFFRRNALIKKESDMNCPFNNSCELNRVTRKFCAKCRLRKCFDSGMIKEWILSDEEKQQKKEIRIARRRSLETETYQRLQQSVTQSIAQPLQNQESQNPGPIKAEVVSVIRKLPSSLSGSCSSSSESGFSSSDSGFGTPEPSQNPLVLATKSLPLPLLPTTSSSTTSSLKVTTTVETMHSHSYPHPYPHQPTYIILEPYLLYNNDKK